MPITELASEATAIDLARECLYRFLATALTDPLAEPRDLLSEASSRRLNADAADLLREEAQLSPNVLGFGELPPEDLDLASVLAASDRPRGEIVAEYDRVFGLVPSRECPPYETEYCTTSEPFYRAQQLADVAGFYGAFGLEPARNRPDRPDHIVLELEFMAFLIAKKRLAEHPDQAAVCEEAQATFFRDHLAWWTPSFATGLRRKGAGSLYAAVGQVLASYLPLERIRFGMAPPRVPLTTTMIEQPEEQAGCTSCSPKTRPTFRGTIETRGINEGYAEATEGLPRVYSTFPKLGEAWDTMTRAGKEGPLADNQRLLVKLAIAIGAMREGAVHSNVRKALAAGVPIAEIEQVIALAGSTIGLPATVAVFTWVQNAINNTKQRSK